MKTALYTAILALGLCMAMAGVGRASTLQRLPGNPGYVHEVFTVADGLPRAGIAQALQTRDGYFWFATFDGLVRFDGARFEVFDSGRIPALGSNRIYQLVETRDGTLWIRTEQGHIVRYADGEFTSCGMPQRGRVSCGLRQAGAAYFTTLYEDSAGTLWIGGPAGLFQDSEGGLREVPGIKTESGIQMIFRDRSGRLWLGTRRGLWMGRPGRFTRVPLPAGRFGQGFPTVAQGAGGEIWVSAPRAIGRLQGGKFLPEIESGGLLTQAPQGGILIALPDRLLFQRGNRRETLWTKEEGSNNGPDVETLLGWAGVLRRSGAPVLYLFPARGSVNTITRDRSQTIWITTSRAGELHALHPARVATVSEGLPNEAVYPIYEDRDGTVWAGGGEFLAALAPGAGRFRVLANPLGSPSHQVMAFLRDRAGVLWIGTSQGLFTGGLDGLTPAGPEAFRPFFVRAIFEDSRGVLWVGSDDGLFRRENGEWSRITSEDGLSHSWVRVIRETPDGALWLGTNGGGVIRLFDGNFTPITQTEGLSSNLVRAIRRAPDGRLWVATENRGLNRIDPATLEIATVGERQGLYSSGIHQMVPDGFGNFWMSSNNGIFRASLADLNAVADGKLPRLQTVAYTERDGMANREANGSVQDAGFRDRAGRIWFPTQEGLARLDPRELLRRRQPPPVHVASLRSGEDEIPLRGGPVRLSPRQRSFTVGFTAPSFRVPERQRFRYRLAGYDRDWIDAGTRREASYTKVPSGRYTFEVLASGPDGNWSANPATVTLEVIPLFYETWWFLLACGLAALAASVFVARLWAVRQRDRQRELERLVAERTATIAEQAEKLRELDDLKSQFFANVSHELRTPLTLTLGPLQDAVTGRYGTLKEDLGGQLQIALRNARRLLGLVDQLLDISRLDAGSLRLRLRRGNLAAAVRQRVEAFLPLAERREIELSLAAPVEPVEAWFDEVQIEKVFDNLLSNALKFTPRGGKVHVSVSAPPESGHAEVSVRDTGPGIPADQLGQVFDRFYQVEAPLRRHWPGAGIGLALARQLVELHRGRISVESAEGEGACFTVGLRRGREHLPPELIEEGTPEREQTPPSGLYPLAADLLDETHARAAPPAEPDDDRTTILVVEDNAEIRAYIRRQLEPDYRVVEAADGVEGLERARQVVPDLVVSDVMMPRLDGNALFRGLRADPELEFIPVILLTAKASAKNRIEGLREGVDDYLVKPFDPRELRARVDNLIASRKRLLDRLAATPPRPLRAKEVQVTSADESFLSRVQAAVEERLGDSELSVEGLAQALSCDRSYLLRKLRALTGETPSGLIRSLRLQRAEQLLRANAGTVSEVAYTVGFKSVAHFSNAFQERYGERPSAFAARHR